MQRLGPPQWPAYPPGAAYARLYDRDRNLGLAAAKLGGRLIAADLAALGITVDCLPIADVPVHGADKVIGDRAYGQEPGKVAAIAAALTQGLAEGRRCCPCSSTSRDMGAPPPTATCDCRSSPPTGRRWKRRISPHFVRWRRFRWG